MTTQEIIKMLRDIIAGYRTTDGIPADELTMAADRLEELQTALSETIKQRDYERERADGNWEDWCKYKDELNQAEAEIGRIKNLLEHVKADRELIRNAGLRADKQRDEAQLLNQELKTELNHALVELHQARANTRSEPSRLEIAAMIYSNLGGTSIARAIIAADELIAAEKENK